MMEKIQIGEGGVGPGYPTYVIAVEDRGWIGCGALSLRQTTKRWVPGKTTT